MLAVIVVVYRIVTVAVVVDVLLKNVTDAAVIGVAVVDDVIFICVTIPSIPLNFRRPDFWMTRSLLSVANTEDCCVKGQRTAASALFGFPHCHYSRNVCVCVY